MAWAGVQFLHEKFSVLHHVELERVVDMAIQMILNVIAKDILIAYLFASAMVELKWLPTLSGDPRPPFKLLADTTLAARKTYILTSIIGFSFTQARFHFL